MLQVVRMTMRLCSSSWFLLFSPFFNFWLKPLLKAKSLPPNSRNSISSNIFPAKNSRHDNAYITSQEIARYFIITKWLQIWNQWGWIHVSPCQDSHFWNKPLSYVTYIISPLVHLAFFMCRIPDVSCVNCAHMQLINWEEINELRR